MNRAKILLSVVCLSCSLQGCNKYQERQESKRLAILQQEALAKEKSDKFVNEVRHRKAAVLLSVKHNIEEKTLFNLFIELDGILHEDGPELTRKDFDSLSQKHGIPPEKLAALLVDHIHMTGTD